jgi:hypothetical protein
MAMTAGGKLGSYEILAPIGAGGMGEVYRARDGKLKRDVALKVLPEVFASDPDRMARFQREAEVLASLNHPNIAHIYGVEEHALVMELVEGESPKGPMAFDDAWKIAIQIADALEYAHERGIVHRDLKPANVKVTPEGVVKLLDFGLARVAEGSAGDVQNSPTVTISPMRAGVILGTAAYMSPEQARGKIVDKRADIWAFGVVLYEMLTGERLFGGETVSDILAGVLKSETDLSKAPREVRRLDPGNPTVDFLLGRCLEKDPRKRLRDIGDAMPLVETPATAPTPAPVRANWLAWAVAALLMALAAPLAFVHFRETAPETPVIRTLIAPPPNTAFSTSGLPGMAAPPAFSPDGRRMVFGVREQGGKTRLWVRALDSVSAQPLPGTEDANHPFFSPDGKFIAFFADGALKKLNSSGGPVFTLCQTNSIGGGGTWNDDDVILFAPGGTSHIFRIAASGGTPVPVTEENGRFPRFLPDGRHFIFHSNPAGGPAVYAGSLDSKKAVRVVDADSQAAYFGGYLVYIRGDVLAAQRFDLRRLTVSGDPVPVAENTRLVAHRIGVFSLSQTGLLLYQAGQTRCDLSWFDRICLPG